MLVIGDNYVADEIIQRTAVKAIAVSDGQVLLLRPAGRDDLKFPGGGVEPGEDDASALTRELKEETGYLLVSIRAPAVTTQERRPARERPGAVFEMISRYYWCDVVDGHAPQTLDDYEQALGFTPQWIAIDEASQACRRAHARPDHLPWTAREHAVIEWLSTQDTTR